MLMDGWQPTGTGMSNCSGYSYSLEEYGDKLAFLLVAAPEVGCCDQKCKTCALCVVTAALAGFISPPDDTNDTVSRLVLWTGLASDYELGLLVKPQQLHLLKDIQKGATSNSKCCPTYASCHQTDWLCSMTGVHITECLIHSFECVHRIVSILSHYQHRLGDNATKKLLVEQLRRSILTSLLKPITKTILAMVAQGHFFPSGVSYPGVGLAFSGGGVRASAQVTNKFVGG